MSISEQDVRELIDVMDHARDRWINGQLDFSPAGPFHQADDTTIFGPFGGTGPPPGIAVKDLEARQAAVAAQFHGGEGSCEVIRTIVEGNLVVLVMIERSEVRFAVRDAPHRWVLRTTQVFTRSDGQWVRLHRHADPLIVGRSLEATLALLATE